MQIPLIGALLALAMSAPAVLVAGEWSDDFNSSLDRWLLPLPQHWKHGAEDGNGYLSLVVGRPIGKPRRPVKFAVLKEACVADFDLDVRMRRNEKTLIITFGYQDRTRFYYTHISVDDGDHSVHNGIFKVHGGSCYRIAGLGSEPALPTTEWTKIRVVRDVATGKIEVYAGEDPKPRFEAIDPSFKYGGVGLGSFDETGDFDDFHLSGETSDACPSDDLSPLDPS